MSHSKRVQQGQVHGFDRIGFVLTCTVITLKNNSQSICYMNEQFASFQKVFFPQRETGNEKERGIWHVTKVAGWNWTEDGYKHVAYIVTTETLQESFLLCLEATGCAASAVLPGVSPSYPITPYPHLCPLDPLCHHFSYPNPSSMPCTLLNRQPSGRSLCLTWQSNITFLASFDKRRMP